jgi:predicted RNA-binding protein with RPS1 domain
MTVLGPSARSDWSGITTVRVAGSPEAVVARPPSNLYRFQKLVRRNKLVFAATAAVALALVVGTMGSTWEAIRARRAERAAAEAERELVEWKKLKFMQDRVGEDFEGLIVNVTKFGFFVELNELFIEGLVPLNSLTDDQFNFHENTRQIIGGRSKKTYSIGNKVRVLVDRIDRMQRKIQFAIFEEKPPSKPKGKKKRG